MLVSGFKYFDVHTHAYTHTRVRTRTHAYTHTRMHACTHTRTHVHMHTRTHVHTLDACTRGYTVNQGSEDAFNDAPYNYGKLDFNNEMEYQPGSPYAGSAVGTVSNVNMFLNTLKFKNSPTGVMMLHAAKPTTNLESLGYGWTWWRSTGDNSTSPNFPDDLKQNHFAYNWWNWNSVAPFIKTVPWNSIRLDVASETNRRTPIYVIASFL